MDCLLIKPVSREYFSPWPPSDTISKYSRKSSRAPPTANSRIAISRSMLCLRGSLGSNRVSVFVHVSLLRLKIPARIFVQKTSVSGSTKKRAANLVFVKCKCDAPSKHKISKILFADRISFRSVSLSDYAGSTPDRPYFQTPYNLRRLPF